MRLEGDGDTVGATVGPEGVGEVLGQGGHWPLAGGGVLEHKAHEGNHGKAARRAAAGQGSVRHGRTELPFRNRVYMGRCARACQACTEKHNGCATLAAGTNTHRPFLISFVLHSWTSVLPRPADQYYCVSTCPVRGLLVGLDLDQLSRSQSSLPPREV